MEKLKLTQKEIEERRRAVRSAEIMASLDNNAKESKEWIEAKEKWINGEISDEDLEKAAFKR